MFRRGLRAPSEAITRSSDSCSSAIRSVSASSSRCPRTAVKRINQISDSGSTARLCTRRTTERGRRRAGEGSGLAVGPPAGCPCALDELVCALLCAPRREPDRDVERLALPPGFDLDRSQSREGATGDDLSARAVGARQHHEQLALRWLA